MSGERREFTRIPIPRDQSVTLLRAGRREFNVHLIDATPQGYAVTCPEKLSVGRGDLLQLRTSEGWVEVRVARMEPFADHHDYPAEFDCCIGLERLRTLGPDDSLSSGGRTIAVVFAIALVAGLIAGTIFLPQSQYVWRQIRAAVVSIVQLGR